MPHPPLHAADYTPEDLELLRAGCLEVATSLGDLMKQVVIVGGYVPTLLVDVGDSEPPSTELFSRHVGTRDLDLAFSVTLLENEEYDELANQLRQAGFEPDVNREGRPTSQRWRFAKHPELKLDFLIPPLEDSDRGGRLKNLGKDFAAFIIPGLELVQDNYVNVIVSGVTLRGARGKESIRVCSPAIFVVLKGLAMGNRGKDKDDYDVLYLLKRHKAGVNSAASDFAQLMRNGSPEASKVLTKLRERYEGIDSPGPVAVSQFLTGANDENIQADAWVVMADFITYVDQAH